MHAFQYAAPETLDDALALLREHRDEARVLAGGQSLVPLLNYRLARPKLVVDIAGLPLHGVVLEDGRLRLGALVRHHQLEESDTVARHCPMLGEAARLIGNVRVRALGTLGGSLAHAGPRSRARRRSRGRSRPPGARIARQPSRAPASRPPRPRSRSRRGRARS